MPVNCSEKIILINPGTDTCPCGSQKADKKTVHLSDFLVKKYAFAAPDLPREGAAAEVMV